MQEGFAERAAEGGAETLSVLFVLPAQYFLDPPPCENGEAASAPGQEAPQDPGSLRYPYEKPIMFDYGYLYSYVTPYMKSFIESLEADGRRFAVTVVDEGFPPSQPANGSGPAYAGFLGTPEEILADPEKLAWLDGFDVLALTGQIHQIARAHDLAKLGGARGLATLWGGVGVSSVYLETHPGPGYAFVDDPDNPMSWAWKQMEEVADSLVVGEAYYQTELQAGNGSGRESLLAKALRGLLPKVEARRRDPQAAPAAGSAAAVHDEYFREAFSAENAPYLPLGSRNHTLPAPDYDDTPTAYLHNVSGIQYRLGCRFNCSFCIVTRVQRQSHVRGHRKMTLEDFLAELEHSAGASILYQGSIFFLDDDFFGTPVDDLMQIVLALRKRRKNFIVQGDVRTILTFRDQVRVLAQPGSGELWALVNAEERPADGPILWAGDGSPIDRNTLFRVSTKTGRLIEKVVEPRSFLAWWRSATLPFFEYLTKNGLSMIFLGLETVDQDELSALGKATYRRIEQGYEALRYLESIRCLYVANMIVGGQGRTRGTGYGKLLTDLHVPLATTFVETAYPGTPIYRKALEGGTLYFPSDELGMAAFKYFDSLRGNIQFPDFDIYQQRAEAQALNEEFFAEDNIRTRMAPFTPSLVRDGGRWPKKMGSWGSLLFHNYYYQRNVAKGLNAPYAGGLDRDEIPVVVGKALDCAVDLLLAGKGGRWKQPAAGLVRSRMAEILKAVARRPSIRGSWSGIYANAPANLG